MINKTVVYYTKLNKKGELVIDEVKTQNAANDSNNFKLMLVKSGTPEYKKLIKEIIGEKTKDVCAKENLMIFPNESFLAEADPLLLNAIGQQIMYFSQNPLILQAMLDTCDVKHTDSSPLIKVASKLVTENALLDFAN